MSRARQSLTSLLKISKRCAEKYIMECQIRSPLRLVEEV
jgi:hypothetical protein